MADEGSEPQRYGICSYEEAHINLAQDTNKHGVQSASNVDACLPWNLCNQILMCVCLRMHSTSKKLQVNQQSK